MFHCPELFEFHFGDINEIIKIIIEILKESDSTNEIFGALSPSTTLTMLPRPCPTVATSMGDIGKVDACKFIELITLASAWHDYTCDNVCTLSIHSAPR